MNIPSPRSQIDKGPLPDLRGTSVKQASTSPKNVKKNVSNFAFRAVAGLLAVSFTFAPLSTAHAQNKVLDPGDAVTSGFSGIAPTGEAPKPGGSPLDTFFINLDGPSAQIFSFNSLGGLPQGQLVSPPPKKVFKAKEIGQVFSITMDGGFGSDIPNIYFGATSAFGVHIARPDPDAPGKFIRLRKGHGEAQWMSGMFAENIGGGPGSILKVDGQTGAISVFANLPENSGPGVGDVVFDKASKSLFASNLDNGLIYRIDANGQVVGTFDHGITARPSRGLAPVADNAKQMDITDASFDTENPDTWGYTQKDRMVYGMAVHNSRLFYAVAGGQQVWSVGILGNGAFSDDARWELDVKLLTGKGPITDMLFDKQGRMYLAQRGSAKGNYNYAQFASPGQSTVVRYRPEQPDDPATEGTWVNDAQRYAIGMPDPHQNSNGGIALGFAHNDNGQPRPGTGDKMLWTTGEKLRTSAEDDTDPEAEIDVHGLQGNDTSLVRPENEPPQQSYFIDYDGLFNDPEKSGHMGDVEIWQPAGDFAQLPPYGGGGYYIPPLDQPPGDYIPPEFPNPGYDLNLRLTKRAAPKVCTDAGTHWRCRYRVRVRNTSLDNWFHGPIHVQDTFLGLPAGSSILVPGHPFPWTCWWVAAPDSFKCRRNAVLAPGASVALTVIARVPKGKKRCRLSNSAEISWPVGGSWNNTDPADDFDIATAIIPDPKCKPNGQKSNLRLKKTAKPNFCAKSPTGKIVCRFRVSVRNTGPGVFKGPIHVRDIPPAGVSLGFVPVPPGVGFSCAPDGPGARCQANGAPVTLGVGDVVGFNIYTLTTPERARELGCKIRNRARILLPVGGTNKNINPGDDADAATATVPANICNEPETNLTIRKRSEGACTADGGNVKCIWKIKVRNTTGNTYKGPLTLNETLPGEPVTASWNAPWNCVGSGGGGGGAICSRGYTEIPGFGEVNLRLVTKFTHAVVKANNCKMTNLVEIAQAAGGTPMNTNAGDDTAQATANAPQHICFTPVPVECPPGYTLDASGKNCVRKGRPQPPIPLVPEVPEVSCPSGYQKVRGSRVARLRRQGWELFRLSNRRWCGRPGVTKPDPVCPPNTVGKYPDCRSPEVSCPSGYTKVRGSRVARLRRQGWELFRLSNRRWCGRPGITKPDPVCPQGTVGKYPDCRTPEVNCPSGYKKVRGGSVTRLRRKGWSLIRLPNGRWCGRPGIKQPDPVCPPNTVGKYPDCRKPEASCPSGYNPVSRGQVRRLRRKGWTIIRLSRTRFCGRPGVTQPVCPPNTYGKYPKCIPIVKPCPTGMVRRGKICVPVIKPCPRGTVRRGRRCVPVVIPCPRGTVRRGRRCVPVILPCPPGKVRSRGRCIPVIKPCPRGMVRSGRRCIPVIKPCPRGMVRRGRKCVAIIRPCPRGTVRRHGRCRPVTIRCQRGTVRRNGRCIPITIRRPNIRPRPNVSRPRPGVRRPNRTAPRRTGPIRLQIRPRRSNGQIR